MESFEHHPACAVRIQFDIVTYGAGRKQAIYSPGCDQFLLNDDIEQCVAFAEDLTRLRAMLWVFKNPRINSLQSPGMEERAPVNELAQHRQREVIQYADTGE